MSDDDNDSLDEFDEDERMNDFDFLKMTANRSDTVGSKCELKLYEARYNYKGDRKPIQVGKHQDRTLHSHEDDDSALVFTRWYTWEREIERTQLVIRSLHLKTALKEVIKEYPGIHLQSGNITISNLPKCLFHYRDELQAYGLTLPFQSEAFEHLMLLLKHMWEQLSMQWISWVNLMEFDLIKPGLEWEHLWMAFKPGDLLYSKTRGDGFIITRLTETAKTNTYWDVWSVIISDNGEKAGYVRINHEIDKYDNYCPLEDLKIFPLRYHPNGEELREQAIARGKKSMSLRGIHYRMYDGLTETLGPHRKIIRRGQIDVRTLHTTSMKSRIMIDASTFAKQNPNNIHFHYYGAGKLPMIEGTNLYNLSDEHFMIYDNEVPGFSLQDKKWCWFHVDHITDVEFNTRAFENLLLPQDQKDLIYSLVDVHSNKSLQFDDVIRGKGKGMVFLLHGVPGVGKTLTAESVADQTKRPLYTISCGELGVEPIAVETNLKAALNLATTWNAIVLIDEADVFLEQRSLQDIDRNGLVSIFLRLMEYYEGILILTTNRVASFDNAFKSRIHLAIKYNALSPAYRAELWRSFIASTASNDLPTMGQFGSVYTWLTEEYLAEISKGDLNGRQIKNTVRTANALAVSAREPLQPKHLNTALRAMRMFDSDFAESRAPAEEEGDVRRSNKRQRIE